METPSFQDIPLAACLQEAIAAKGYQHPSPIQAAAIPPALQGKDVLAVAQTGTGKTASFALPVLHQLRADARRPYRGEVRALVLTPTRELAVQVADSFKAYGAGMRLRCGLVYGGVSQRPQEKLLREGVDVLVACPGRLLDLMGQRLADLSEVRCLVLDEADRMLDMGFINDIRKIVERLPEDRQTLFFSATMPPAVASLAASLLRHPEEIRIEPERTTAEGVRHSVRFLQSENKLPNLVELLEGQSAGRSLVFSKTKHGANKLAEKLSRMGIRSEAIHGNKTQAARQRSLERFRSGAVGVLVATDVAARGLDIKEVTLVVNFDLPIEPESYVHRIGRTARAGATGEAVSLCCHEEYSLLRGVERSIGRYVEVD